MIWLFNLFVFGLLLVAALYIFLEHRDRRMRSPVAVSCEVLVQVPPSPNGQPKPTEKRIIGLSAEVQDDGVRLEFYMPPNRRGNTSPITSLISTRQHDEHGTIYKMTTASGSAYLVSMCDDTAKRVLSVFYVWKAGRDLQTEPACKRLGQPLPESHTLTRALPTSPPDGDFGERLGRGAPVGAK
jgi:hypothetical protein